MAYSGRRRGGHRDEWNGTRPVIAGHVAVAGTSNLNGRGHKTVATAALVMQWGRMAQGRERQALRVWGEGIQYWQRLQEQGEIESFEPVLLEAGAGDVAGFMLVRGERERLDQIRRGDEFAHLCRQMSFVSQHLRVAGGFLGEELGRQMIGLEAAVVALTER